MRLAILISGRIFRYDKCLLPLLQKNTQINIDLFVSINDIDSYYYTLVKKDLSPWLKDIYINLYEFPLNFNHTHIGTPGYICINSTYKPLNQMSMYFNDNNAFKMAIQYSKQYNFTYDVIMKYRADIINSILPNFHIEPIKPDILYYARPICCFITHGLFKVPCISDAWCWGSPTIMEKYCDTYNFVLKTLETTNGNYYIAFEDCITDNCYDKHLKFLIINLEYHLDINRRLACIKFGKNFNAPIKDSLTHLVFNTSDITINPDIPPIVQE